MLLSLIIPVYYNEENLPVTWEAMAAPLANLPDGLDWEVIFVDDGSGDGSYTRLKEIQQTEPERVRIVKLSRNFGQVAAILAGFRVARGDCCVVTSADLQDPPELIVEMAERWRGGEHKIVLAVRAGNEDARPKRVLSRIFYRAMRRFALPNMPDGGFDYFLVDRSVVDIMNESDEKSSFLQGQVLWTGFTPELIPYTRRRREIGRSRWTWSKKLEYLIDGFVSYSDAPIRLITLVGLFISLCSFAYAFLILVLRIWWSLPVVGWAPLMIVILMLGGVQLVMLGVIGEYIWRGNHETRRRPSFVIEEVIEAEEG
jgi:dolichol-phosphate mannosyltransferase